MFRQFPIFLFLVAILALGSLPANAQSDIPLTIPPSKMADNAIRGFILPGYELVSQQAELQGLTIKALCDSPSQAALEKARQQYSGLVKAWSRIEIIKFGPVQEDNRLERILFWPDRKSTGLKQVQRAIITKDETVTDLSSLQQKSVALQGLGALEFILFGTGANEMEGPDGQFRCHFGHTVALAITETANEIVKGWEDPDGVAEHLRNPTPDRRDYRTETEVLSEIFGTWVHSAEMMRDTRLTPILGGGEDSSKPKLGLYWRSNLTIPQLRWNVAGLKDIFIISGMGDVLKAEDRWSAGSYIFELDNFDRTSAEITGPIAEVLADQKGWTKVNYLLILSKSMQKIAVEQLANYLGIGVGFSTLDGD